MPFEAKMLEEGRRCWTGQQFFALAGWNANASLMSLAVPTHKVKLPMV